MLNLHIGMKKRNNSPYLAYEWFLHSFGAFKAALTWRSMVLSVQHPEQTHANTFLAAVERVRAGWVETYALLPPCPPCRHNLSLLKPSAVGWSQRSISEWVCWMLGQVSRGEEANGVRWYLNLLRGKCAFYIRTKWRKKISISELKSINVIAMQKQNKHFHKLNQHLVK